MSGFLDLRDPRGGTAPDTRHQPGKGRQSAA